MINGVAAAPAMAMASNEKAMGKFAFERPLKLLGWTATGVMAVATIAMFAFDFWPSAAQAERRPRRKTETRRREVFAGAFHSKTGISSRR